MKKAIKGGKKNEEKRQKDRQKHLMHYFCLPEPKNLTGNHAINKSQQTLQESVSAA
jgi:hypothetical protein